MVRVDCTDLKMLSCIHTVVTPSEKIKKSVRITQNTLVNAKTENTPTNDALTN